MSFSCPSKQFWPTAGTEESYRSSLESFDIFSCHWCLQGRASWYSQGIDRLVHIIGECDAVSTVRRRKGRTQEKAWCEDWWMSSEVPWMGVLWPSFVIDIFLIDSVAHLVTEAIMIINFGFHRNLKVVREDILGDTSDQVVSGLAEETVFMAAYSLDKT